MLFDSTFSTDGIAYNADVLSEGIPTYPTLINLPVTQADTEGIAKAIDIILNPMLDAGMTFIDPARFASDPLMMWEYPAIPYLTLRIAAMASVHFDVDMCLSCVNKEVSSFYTRSFGSSEIAQPRTLAGVTHPIALYGAKIADIRERLETRFPFFKSQPYEQRMMFGKIEDLTYPPLNILPSAKYANQTVG